MGTLARNRLEVATTQLSGNCRLQKCIFCVHITPSRPDPGTF